MEDLVKDEAVIEPFLDVARAQVARGKPFFDTLSKTLDVEADYNVSHFWKRTRYINSNANT